MLNPCLLLCFHVMWNAQHRSVAAQARAKELRLELLNSERLKAHFEAHPGDLALLRHDKVTPPLRSIGLQVQLYCYVD